MSVEIKKVETRKELTTFIDFHYDLYAGCPYDVPNLFIDEMTTLRKDKNVAFDFCEAEYYLAYKNGKLAGRVAAIIRLAVWQPLLTIAPTSVGMSRTCVSGGSTS